RDTHTFACPRSRETLTSVTVVSCSILGSLISPVKIMEQISCRMRLSIRRSLTSAIAAPLQLLRELPGFVDLDGVPDSDVVEALQPDSAFEAFLDLPRVVLETLERGYFALEDLYSVPNQPDLGVASHLAAHDLAAGNGADLRYLEGVAHLDCSDLLFTKLGLQESFHRRADVLQRVVDDVVFSNLNLLAVSKTLRRGARSHVEPYDQRVGCGGEHDIALIDRSCRSLNHVQLHFRG